MNEKHKNTPQIQSETLSLIKQQFFKTKMCPFQKNKNYCLNESNCHYAHSIDELKPMPDLRNTKLCDYIKKKIPCRNVNCKFAHDINTLKPSVHLATYKSTICSFWGKGKCFNGNKCRFAHGSEDIKTNEDIDLLENAKHIKKNKNKISICDIKQGTSSTNSFNTCDYSINCSMETTNVSSFDKSREVFMLKKNNSDKEKTKEKNKVGSFNLNKNFFEDKNEIINSEITGNGLTFCDKKNSNSIKEVIDKIENMTLSTFIENNDKYTKVIKYLLNENNLLKESLRKDQVNIILEQEQEQEEQKNKTSFGSSITETNSKMNSEDLTKYLFLDDNNEKVLISNQKRNENMMSSFDDTTRIDENFNSIIKTIDDILISQNVSSFPSLKDVTTSYDNKDIFSIKNSNDINRECGNLLCNLKSFENLKNIYPNFNSFNIIDKKANNKVEEEVLEQFFQQNSTNNEQTEKKKSYYDENFTFAKSKSFPYDNHQTKESEEFSQKKNNKSITRQHKEQENQEIQNIQQRLMQLQQMKKEELNKSKDINSWQNDFVILRNDYNISSSSSNHSNKNISNINNINNINNLNLMQKYTPNIIREKNAKLNLRENAGLNDNSMNLDKLLEFSNEKSDIIKKIRNIISNELKNNENENYTNKKISNFTNISNFNNSLNTKNILFNDNLYSTTFNKIPANSTNHNILNNNTINNTNNSDYKNNHNNNGYMNDNNNHKLNNDLSKYKKEINNDQNIWNNHVNFNEYAYPILSHDWINNQKNNDFFNISKSINLSSLN
ncbi:zinc finger protein, putative [Plasmodium gallinaceum]|uniref:Zinc finger protein, putative n=1 Tax=Plasmodium gallinaceum TaxID=5849 RepID=A0A1J1GUC8_PLAGA|nr:zinc finger protein, putative [Plasmodium gallinaceum]CRG95905.1 zinc finger protein, putative [Plasmodium gallinaceum]